jgi:hypothetical protein
MAAPHARTTSVPDAVRSWWAEVPEPDKGIVTGAVGFGIVILLLLAFLVLHAG